MWQTRCAQTLEGEVHPAALELLMSFMASDNGEVVMAAADTLLSLAQSDTTVEMTPQLSALVRVARLNAGARYGFVLDLLLKNSRQTGLDGQ